MKIIEPPAEENVIKSFTPEGEVYETSRKEKEKHDTITDRILRKNGQHSCSDR